MKLFLLFVLLCGCSVVADDSNPRKSSISVSQYTYIIKQLAQLKRTVARLQQSIANQQRNGLVAFTARLYKTKRHLGAGQTIIFGSVLTNVGGGYSSITGMFTAPVNGVYVFNYAAMLYGGKYEYLELVKDGNHLLWNYPHATGAKHYASSSRTATVQLNKGNRVWIRTQNAATHGTGYVHVGTGQCTDDVGFDCAHISTLYPVCADVSHAKLVCRHYCNLCDMVDGSWADWSAWSTCDVTCGNGTIVRTRSCTDPTPAHGGSDCSGTNRQQSTCTLQACPVHGGWSVWSTWNNCSVSCGIGLQTRRRTCSNPFPDRFGDHCFGDSLENKACFLQACADGGWSGWSRWGVCSATCNGGIQNRTRRCDNPVPSALGRDCPGNDKDFQSCHGEACPDGGWSGWNSWGVCSATCNGGIQNRTRRCDNPAPLALGKNCPGNDQGFQACHGEACPVVAFKARNVVDTSPTAGSLIRYDAVVVNVGGGYSTSTGYFTAPYTGLYSFTVNICTNAQKELWVQIVAAGNIIDTAYSFDANSIECSSGDGMADLKAGDQVWIKCYTASSGTVIYQTYDIWNSFSGTLIHRTV